MEHIRSEAGLDPGSSPIDDQRSSRNGGVHHDGVAPPRRLTPDPCLPRSTSVTTDDHHPVPVTSVTSRFEADMGCDLLRTAGIECGIATTDSDSAFAGVFAGHIAILVHAADLDTAREVLGEADLPEGASPGQAK
jgi:hypothetical protein